jgi:hypothetical protein
MALFPSPNLLIIHYHIKPLHPKVPLIGSLKCQITDLAQLSFFKWPSENRTDLYTLLIPEQGHSVVTNRNGSPSVPTPQTVGLDLSLQNHGGSKTNMAKSFLPESCFFKKKKNEERKTSTATTPIMLPKAKPLTLLSFASTHHIAQNPQVQNLELDFGMWDQKNQENQMGPLGLSLPEPSALQTPTPPLKQPPKERKPARARI